MVNGVIRLAIGMAALGGTAAVAQPLSPAETAKVDAIVGHALAATGVPSASVAIVRDGKIAFARAYGRQAADMPTPDAAAKYQIASVSKQFTAAAILLLRDEGKLRLDDPVSKYLPGITDGDHITIRQLLSHTSGLQDYWPQDYSFAAMAKPTTPQAILDRWAKKPLDFAPGTQWQYSNTGYVVAGLIVEKVSGEPLLTFLQQHIFGPLDMHPIDQDLAVGKGFPAPYQRFALGPVRQEKPAATGWLFAAGELAMSASDLARWDIARMDRAVLPARDWEEQETPVKLADGQSTGYGLGVEIKTIDGHKAIEHSGEAVGFLSENIVFNQDRDAVVVLVNADFGRAEDQIADGIVHQILFPGSAAAPQAEDAQALARVKQVYAELQQGRLDRAEMTADANYYFTPTALQDYHDSLGPLGAPQAIEQVGTTKLRGGFVNRNYSVAYPGQKLLIVTYWEPGANGRLEQFLVMPAG